MKHQQGVVIVIALFIVALVAVMSYVMMSRFERDTRRTTLILRNVEMENMAQGSIAWAFALLQNNLEKKKNNKPVDVMPIKSPVLKVNGFQIYSTIYDMQSRFNINNLSDGQDETKNMFKRLLHITYPKLSAEKIDKIANATSSWVTLGAQSSADKYYQELSTPYRCPHKYMVSVSELRLVQGVTPEIFNALQPHLAALPSNKSSINVQTALTPVLMMLSSRIDAETAKLIEDIRKQVPFTSVKAFTGLEPLKKVSKKMPVTVESEYFLVETSISIENQQVLLYTLLNRFKNNEKPSVKIIWQSKGQPG